MSNDFKVGDFVTADKEKCIIEDDLYIQFGVRILEGEKKGDYFVVPPDKITPIKIESAKPPKKSSGYKIIIGKKTIKRKTK